jgi:hypothetical protein
MAAPALDRDPRQPCTLTPTLQTQARSVSAAPLGEASVAVSPPTAKILAANGAVIPGAGAAAQAANMTPGPGLVPPARTHMAEPSPGNQVREATSVPACLHDNCRLLLPVCDNISLLPHPTSC